MNAGLALVLILVTALVLALVLVRVAPVTMCVQIAGSCRSVGSSCKRHDSSANRRRGWRLRRDRRDRLPRTGGQLARGEGWGGTLETSSLVQGDAVEMDLCGKHYPTKE